MKGLETGGSNAALENGLQDTDFVCMYVCMLQGPGRVLVGRQVGGGDWDGNETWSIYYFVHTS